VSAVSKLAGAAWKALSEVQQKPYNDAFKKAQAKYATDLEAFLAGGGVKQKGVMALRREKKKGKIDKTEAKLAIKEAKAEAGCPKKPMTPCFAYIQDHRQKISEHDDVKGKGLGAISKKGAELFKGLPASERATYEKKYEEQKREYEEWFKSDAGTAFVAKQKESQEAAKLAAKESKAAAKAAAKEEKVADKVAAKTAAASEGKTPATPNKSKVPSKRGRGTPAAAKTPAKFGRGRGRGRSTSSVAQPMTAIDAAVLAEAAKQGYEAQLKNLAARPEVVASGKSALEMLGFLTKSGGLVNPAKAALLGA
jgi:hypothetical protein